MNNNYLVYFEVQSRLKRLKPGDMLVYNNDITFSEDFGLNHYYIQKAKTLDGALLVTTDSTDSWSVSHPMIFYQFHVTEKAAFWHVKQHGGIYHINDSDLGKLIQYKAITIKKSC